MQPVAAYSEAELLEGCQKGNPRMQRALYEQYHRLLFGICLRYTDNRDDAQDILQEGMVKVFQHLDRFRGAGSFEGWMRRIVIRTAIEHYRRRSRYFMVEIDAAKEESLDADALSRLSREEMLGLIRQLPVGYRTVFNLYAIEGYTHQEIGEMLGISVGTSKSQLSRAKKLLQHQLECLHRSAAKGS